MSEPETFDPDWLALREPADHRSRADDLLPPLRAWWAARGASTVLDLGSGSGSNLRYLAPVLGRPQRWTLVDHDAGLLAHVSEPGGDVRVHTVRGDLAREGLAAVPGAHLVTASALLDLVPRAWLAELVDACAAARCGALFALTYDGRIEWSVGGTGADTTPAARAEDPLDALVRDAVNAHQLRDKGLGPALGPAAAHAAGELLRRRGYRTWLSSSPWVLGPSESALADALVTGWAGAAAEQRPADATHVRAWAEHRRETVARGEFALLVGHLDLLALPAAEPTPGAP
ncbi:MAG: class I SAM-dependent methyltransferase [Chloroflexota bacterium]